MARDAEPSHIDSLAVVCSRWRAIALDSHSLWSHVSFRPYHSRRLDPKLLTLPRLYTSRSGGTPLDVCIFAVSETYSDNSQNNEMKDLCGSIAPRIRSLELDFKRFALNWGDSATNSLISRVFSCCRPGTLTKLVTTGYGSFSFFATADGGNPAVALSSWEMVVGQKRSNLEALLAPITILHLAGVFPYWASLAYRGLVELSLHANFSQGGSIPEPDLIRILESSPGLRILHIEIHITNQVEDISASRVNLPDLELLHLGSKQDLSTNYSQIGIIRLLTTGVKPLYLSIQNDNLGRFSDASKAQIEGFLERSAVTRFRANNILHPFEFLASVFPLEVLVLSECQDLRLPTLPDPHSIPLSLTLKFKSASY
ncbi:hypothetical protein B0J17DRAFT_717528 [Rhizoctonia solani]|nr:hypothetical protein B0J17DRAFT_717528 [Rhizoctonia solani]